MFRTYLLPVEAAVSLFPLIAALFLGPAAVRGYRRRGRAGGWSALVFYSFVFYLLAAVLQTVMPLPADTDAHCSTARYAASPQLQPLAFGTTVSSAAGGDWSPANLLTLTPTWTTLLNAVLLLPLGVYLRYYLRRKLLSATLLAFGTSLFFETTQYTGLWFVYDCPYRQFNVDDLLLNTGGAVVGWLLAGPLARVLPRNDPAGERLRYGSRITLTRRAFAFATDLAGWLVVWTTATGLLAVTAGWSTGRGLALPIGAGLGLVWFWLLPAATGWTPGKRAVLLRVTRPDGGRAGPLRVSVRAWVLYSPLALGWLAVAAHRGAVSLPGPAEQLPLAAVVAGTLLWGWAVPAIVLSRDHRAPYERWSGTANRAVPHRHERAADRSGGGSDRSTGSSTDRLPDSGAGDGWEEDGDGGDAVPGPPSSPGPFGAAPQVDRRR
ncbi:VanZ family protein [Streptomyces sp. 549]|uniref:VanZ family protein n=1 Tax=Streptomyces sp. 549 TaxID=3049076 RepID=UPI0024C23FEE|nr:VanZ family protein [Streptomyces sp. 549]MDK1474609.1 VanZ family protein [Streptomyces sp. 549]